jgi:hypothetical protein
MRILIVTLILVCITAEEIPKKDITTKVKEAAGMIASPEVSAAIEILKAIRTESSRTISERHDKVEFLNINNALDHGYGATYTEKLDELIKFWLEDPVFVSMSMEHKTIISRAIKEYSMQIENERYKKAKYDLSFNDGQGKIFMLVLTIEPHPTISRGVKWEKYIAWTTFKPGPSYVVVTTSDCNILSCDRSDEIVYLPTTITDAHIQALMNMNIKMMIDFNKGNLITN